LIKKHLAVLVAPVLMLGLAACNNNANDDMNNRGNNNGPLHVRYNPDRDTNNGRVNDYDNVRYNTKSRLNDRYMNDRDVDHAGPMTENYDKGNKRNAGFNDRFNGRKDMLNISSMETDMNSNKYPHTKAVLIQMAKYQFIPFTLGQAGELPQGLGQQQRPSVSVPRVQQGTPSQQPSPQQGPTAQPAPQQGPTGTQQGPTAQQPTQQQKPAAQAPAQNKTQTTQGISQFAQQVIDLTNVQRKQNGLPALKADTQLSGVAQKKAVDMEKNHYFSHTSPTYGSPFDMMRDFGVTYSSAGENIAMGQKSPQEVVTAWMNSPGHRANILNRSFTNIGVGFDQTGNYWSQMFIGK